MLRVVSGGLWTELHRLATKNRPRLAAVAYVTSDEKVKFGKGDTLVCDATDTAIKLGQTSAIVLRQAHDRGAQLFSSPGLHAKVFLLGRVAVIGSANLSSIEQIEPGETSSSASSSRAGYGRAGDRRSTTTCGSSQSRPGRGSSATRRRASGATDGCSTRSRTASRRAT